MLSLKYYEAQKKGCCRICFKEGEPHHQQVIGMGRDRKKPMPEHYSVIPLCREHHTELHQIGKEKFEKKYHIDIWKEVYRSLSNWLYMEMR